MKKPDEPDLHKALEWSRKSTAQGFQRRLAQSLSSRARRPIEIWVSQDFCFVFD
jgi:hypothetical protein